MSDEQTPRGARRVVMAILQALVIFVVAAVVGVFVGGRRVPGPEAGEAGHASPADDATAGAGAPAADAEGATRALPPVSREELSKQWPSFRGFEGSGISPYDDVPTKWDGESGEGILWKTKLDLCGFGSPIVWGDRVFVTGGKGSKRKLFCFDAEAGKLVWSRDVKTPRSGESPEEEPSAGCAAPTPVTDGRHVWSMFGNGDIACHTVGGEEVWTRGYGPLESMYGYSSSLARWNNVLIVQLDQARDEDTDEAKSALVGLDALTGKEVWRTARDVRDSWSSPVVVETKAGPQVLTCCEPYVAAYEPAGGGLIWSADLLSGDVAPSPVYANGFVYGTNVGCVIAAIRPDGKGDITESHVAWVFEDDLPDTASPLATEQYVFFQDTAGYLSCVDAKTGDLLWDHDFEDDFYSSPSLAGDRLYTTSLEGTTYVVTVADEFKLLGTNELGDGVNTCFAFAPGRIYIRGNESLFCIGVPDPDATP